MSVALNVEPAAFEVPATGAVVHLMLTNTGAERLAFKIKCNNNNDYAFKPVLGCIGVRQSRQVMITRNYGPPADSKMVIHYLPAPIGIYDPKAPFAKPGAQPITITVPIKAITQAVNAPTAGEVANQVSYVGTMCPQGLPQ